MPLKVDVFKLLDKERDVKENKNSREKEYQVDRYSFESKNIRTTKGPIYSSLKLPRVMATIEVNSTSPHFGLGPVINERINSTLIH